MNSFNLRWADEEKTILLSTIPPEWTADELIEYMTQGNQMLDSVSHQVYSIVDARTGGRPTGNIISRFPQMARLSHKRSKIIVIAESHNIWLDIFSRTFGLIKTVPSEEEAYQIIEAWKAEQTST